MIKDITKPEIIQGGISIDDRGQIIYANDFNFADAGVKRFYAVSNHDINFVRSFHYHQKEAKYVVVLKGTALVVIVKVDDPQNPDKLAIPQKYVLSEKNQKILYVPAAYANGFKSLDADTNIVFFSTSTLEESKGDDFRIDWNYWSVWKNDFR